MSAIAAFVAVHFGSFLLAGLLAVGLWVYRHMASVPLLAAASRAVGAAVYSVAQTFVDGCKERSADGKLTAAEAAEAFALAKRRAIESLGPTLCAALNSVLGGKLDSWISTAIEAEVKASKIEIPTAKEVAANPQKPRT